MDAERKSFTFIWKIKNFSFSLNDSMGIKSPFFYLHETSQSEWFLNICTKNILEDYVMCRLLIRCYTDPSNLKIDYEISFLNEDKTVIHSETFLNKGSVTFLYTSDFTPQTDEIFVHKKYLFLPNDILTVRCIMWKSQGSISESVKCAVQTRIGTNCKSLDGVIEKFSSLKTSSKNAVFIESLENQAFLSSMKLCVCDDGKLNIKIKPAIYLPKAIYKINIFMLNIYGNKVKFSHEKIYDKQPFCIPLTFSREYLIENKELYLPNDVLTLQAEIIFTKCVKVGTDLEIIDDMVYDYNCQGIQATITNKTNTSPSSEEHHNECLTTLEDDFISLYKEGILSDTKLKTDTETFPAHTAVLSARSPVFKSMFATDMREKTNSCVDIEDLDADTVHQMLVFIYSDRLDNLHYESAKNLYFAADKYNIISLRHRCSSFMKENLLHSNCCDVLLLADKHQDEDLKRSVQDCIAENDDAVFSSDKWKELEENHPRLTTETFRAVYMKNRRT